MRKAGPGKDRDSKAIHHGKRSIGKQLPRSLINRDYRPSLFPFSTTKCRMGWTSRCTNRQVDFLVHPVTIVTATSGKSNQSWNCWLSAPRYDKVERVRFGTCSTEHWCETEKMDFRWHYYSQSKLHCKSNFQKHTQRRLKHFLKIFLFLLEAKGKVLLVVRESSAFSRGRNCNFPPLHEIFMRFLGTL